MSQIDGGDYNAERGRGSGGSSGHLHQGAMQALERFIPRRYKDGISQEELKYAITSLKWPRFVTNLGNMFVDLGKWRMR